MALPRVADWDLSDVSVTSPYFGSLIQQLIKDFQVSELEDRLLKLEQGDFSGLLKEVSGVLEWLVEYSPGEFTQKLYVIDLPERLMNKVVGGSVDDWDVFVDQVVRRELLKVVLKAHYSSK